MEFTEFGNKSGKTLMLLPEKRHYQNPDKHIDSFLRGVPLFTVVAVQAAGIVTVIG